MCLNCEHVHICLPVGIRVYMCFCVHVSNRVYMRGIPGPPTLTPAKPREGAAAVAVSAAERPSSRSAPPPPRPLPAGRFANRPNRQKLRARGPLGAFLLWCELPMAGTGASTGNLAQLNQPGRRARSPGRQAERRARAATAGAPSPSSATPPGPVANGRTRGGAGGGVGPGASHRLRPPGPGRPAEPPRPERSGKSMACPGEVSR